MDSRRRNRFRRASILSESSTARFSSTSSTRAAPSDNTPSKRQLHTRNYDDIDPIKHYCDLSYHASAVVGDKLYIDGGLATYNNGTRQDFPNTFLRIIDFSKPFSTSSINGSSISILSRPVAVPELSTGALWPSPDGDYILQVNGYDEPNGDRRFPGVSNMKTGSNEVWSYTISNDTWNKLPSGKSTPLTGLQRVWNGSPLTVHTPSTQKAFYLGGETVWSNNPSPGLLTYDFSTNNTTNTTMPFTSNLSTTLHIPVGPSDRASAGLLITLAGQTRFATPSSMSSAWVHDLSTGEFSQQMLEPDPLLGVEEGIPPQRWNHCAVVAEAPDKSSWNIYVYGGHSFLPNDTKDEAPVLGDVWVLSIPAFQWFRVHTGEGPDTLTGFVHREGHTCDIIGKGGRQMLSFGGLGRAVVKDEVCDTTGVGVFDLTELVWKEGFDPETAAAGYQVPKGIFETIGGDATGGATKLPAAGLVSENIGELFKSHLQSLPPRNNPINPVNPPPKPSKNNTATIAGATVGAVLFLLLAGIIYYRRVYRHRTSRGSAHGSRHTTEELPGVEPSPRMFAKHKFGRREAVEMPTGDEKGHADMDTSKEPVYELGDGDERPTPVAKGRLEDQEIIRSGLRDERGI